MSEFSDLQLLVDTAACVHEVKKHLQGFGDWTPAWQISFMRFNSDRKQQYKIWDSIRQISSFLRSKSDGQTDIRPDLEIELLLLLLILQCRNWILRLLACFSFCCKFFFLLFLFANGIFLSHSALSFFRLEIFPNLLRHDYFPDQIW